MSELLTKLTTLTQAQQIRLLRQIERTGSGPARNGEILQVATLVLQMLQQLPPESITDEFINSVRKLVHYCTNLGLRQTDLGPIIRVFEDGLNQFNQESSTSISPQHPPTQ